MRREDGQLEPDRIVSRMGADTGATLGVAPASGDEIELFAWWVACGLRAADRRDAVVARALAALRERGWLSARALVEAGEAVSAVLDATGVRRAPAVAARLARGSRALIERHEGSLAHLAAGSPSFQELGERLVSLGPGFGPGTALRFLRPLRDLWPAADDAPLDPAAHAAAVHLGWLDESDDPETAPSMLRRRLSEHDDPPPLPRLEDALERLGRAACRRGDTARCPLGAECPHAD